MPISIGGSHTCTYNKRRFVLHGLHTIKSRLKFRRGEYRHAAPPLITAAQGQLYFFQTFFPRAQAGTIVLIFGYTVLAEFTTIYLSLKLTRSFLF
jgi:hypothetical protein